MTTLPGPWQTGSVSKGRFSTILGGAFGLIGLVLLCVGIALAASTASFLASATRTDGTVVALTDLAAPASLTGHQGRGCGHGIVNGAYPCESAPLPQQHAAAEPGCLFGSSRTDVRAT